MLDQLRKNIEYTIKQPMPEAAFALLQDYFVFREFDKKTQLQDEGAGARFTYFILSGSAYSYYVDDAGHEHVLQFAIENHWIADQYSFFSGQPAIFFIETLEPVQALVITRENFDKLCNSHPVFDRFFRILIQNAFTVLIYRLTKTLGESAETRYRDFCTRYPHFAARVPQYLVASFLGVKPQSLSRIRKEISHSKKT